MARFVPIPDPGGSLQPPRRPPPTALATATPQPEPNPLPRPVVLDMAAVEAASRQCASLLQQFELLRGPPPRRSLRERLATLVARGAELASRLGAQNWH